MTLLDEVIEIATDTKQSLSVLLRKCLLLAYELKNDRLKSWANQELNGYAPTQEIPDYRVMHIGAHGHFRGLFNQRLHNEPIAPSMLEQQHRGYASKVELRQAISCYESASASNDGSLTYNWPGDLNLYYQDKLIEDFALVKAWQSVPASAISGVLDAIRNRTLNMALELREEFGDVSSMSDKSGATNERVSQAVTHNIFNSPAYFASGDSQVNVVTSGNQTVISPGSRDDLDQVLLRSGLSQPDVQDLSVALEQDGKSLGANVKSWITKTAPKLLVGGVKVGGKITQSLLMEWLNQYFGLAK